MKLRCWRCWGTGVVTVRGDVIPYAELTAVQAAEESVLGGFHYRSAQQPCTWCRGQGHWLLVMRRNRMTDFAVMAGKVDHALAELRSAQSDVENARNQLRNAEQKAVDRQVKVDAARDAMFDAYPELRPAPAVVPRPTVEWTGGDDEGFVPRSNEITDTGWDVRPV